jgi:hypothetical protein
MFISTMKSSHLYINLALLVSAFLFVYTETAPAAVQGNCSGCHTMHNSQDGSIINADGPVEKLLKDDCVGCHSSSGSDTIVVSDGNNIPIVFNTSVPTNPLAGGNFYWVQAGGFGDAYGHNVYGISDADATLSAAPASTGCINSCHTSLALADEGNGCEGCHNNVLHHGTDPTPGDPENAASGWYRFLSAPSGHDFLGGAPVVGIEDPNWEQNADADHHNIYYKGTGSDTETPESMGKFCAGCHVLFHSPGTTSDLWGIDNGGGSNPWLRHPADYAIPNDGEYAAIIGSDYDPVVPVGKSLTGTVNKVELGDTVMCLSCHRAHGSPYPDMLRWDKSLMSTKTTGAGAGTGCFKCHSAKDGS